ncbi:MAG: response regulator [Planctomycetota bacterium]
MTGGLRSVMLIDDNEADRYLLRRLLRKARVTDSVLEAPDGASALELLANFEESAALHQSHWPPALLLVDLNMPRMTGLEFLTAFSGIRGDHGLDALDVIMMSSSERPEDRKPALVHEFVRGFIAKMPKSAEHLRTEIEALGVSCE